MASSTVTDWNITTDIYGIVDSIEKIKKRYVEDEDETTLALGIYGFITDTEAKKIQTSTIMAGQLGNEMFPTRANLTKNVLVHAIYNNITDINAIPAHITINIGIKVEDLNNYMIDNRFVFDKNCPIFIGTYEFHFDYDIILQRSSINQDIYSAHYDMTENNRLSNVINPYLKQPFLINIGNTLYVLFQATVRQTTIETTTTKIISESIVDNKSLTFDFDNQIADFEVIIEDNGVSTRLTPLLYGSNTYGISNYCWYLFISDNTIRITFDSKSYLPGLNSEVTIRAYTTLGSNGNFNYKKIDDSSEGLFVDFDSDTYNYSKVTCYVVAATNSTDGADKKSKEELQKLIPKAALSRGSLTTETDVQNYFNLLDSEDNRLVLQKKVDNQLERVWYGYFLLKDEEQNIIPTNTLLINVSTLAPQVFLAEDGRYILPSGTIFKYDGAYATIVDESAVPDLYSEDYFDNSTYYYMSVYNIIISPDPVYAAFYLTAINRDSFFIFDWVNEAVQVQFIANGCNFQRSLLTDSPMYKLSFSIAQSIAVDFNLYTEEKILITNDDGTTTENTLVTNNTKVIVVFYKEDVPYRWAEAELSGFNYVDYIYTWNLELETDNGLDNRNDIKILDLHVAGSATDINYGYMNPNTKVVIYTLAKFEEGEYGRYDLDAIAPGFDGYSVTNVYEISEGIDFYENFTNVMNTKCTKESNTFYKISGVPMVGLHYVIDEEKADFLTNAIFDRKSYIDYCLTLLENNMDIDFKFFNTYGPSNTYTIGDAEETSIGHVDLNMRFRVSLTSSSDVYTKDDIIAAIKKYVENLYETGDLHIPNMIKELSNEFESRCNFIEFMNYNDFRLGLQHIIKKEITDPHVVPEFVNIRNVYNDEGVLVPDIEIEVLY